MLDVFSANVHYPTHVPALSIRWRPARPSAHAQDSNLRPITFNNESALLTVVGKGSIGVEILKGLLSGGARVVVTTSCYSRSTVECYLSIYQSYGVRGSALTVVPFNQGSKQGMKALMGEKFILVEVVSRCMLKLLS